MPNYMANPRIAIVGLGRMGKFHAREFHNSGCDVVAVLCSNQENAKEACEMLKRDYEIDAKPYNNLSLLLKNEKVDAVSICTPYKLHGQNIKTCLDFGVHILCEKPLVINSFFNNYGISKDLIETANRKNKILTLNIQLPTLLSYMKPKNVTNLSMYFEPGVNGIEMLLDHLPHANSILLDIMPKGEMENLCFPSKNKYHIVIDFDFVDKNLRCRIEYILKFKKERPSNYSFTINGEKFTRRVKENYNQSLVSEDSEIEIEDPLKLSIRGFVSAIKGDSAPLISSEIILKNIKLQDEIIKKYFELKNYTKNKI